MAGDNPLARATFQQLRLGGTAKQVEEFQEGDLLLARDEHDPAGPLVLKRIEEIFVRQAFVIELVVRGRTIGTTAEHPFYVVERNDFVAAGEIEIGETFLSHDGQLVQLAGVNNTGRQETVYNFRIADFHTYFVGGKEWGFSVWVHNANYWNEFRKATKGVFKNSTEASAAYHGNWTSPGGLKYGPSTDGGKVRHVLKHIADAPNRPTPHGVFDGGGSTAFSLIDEAYAKILAGGTGVNYFPNKNAYVVDMGRWIGWQGGPTGHADYGLGARYLRVAIRSGTNEVLTAFPQVLPNI